MAEVVNSSPAPAPQGSERVVARFGETELLLGVATNRAVHEPALDESPTAVHYSARGTFIEIDLEHDPQLVAFLQQVKEAVAEEGSEPHPLLAEKITRQVVAQTPKIDYDDTYHQRRALKLGEALQHPVVCIDRCLAMEASLAMYGFLDVAHMPSLDLQNVGDEAHVDVSFTVGDERFVALTMGDMAGSVMPIDIYKTMFITGTRELQEHFARSYFQPVGTQP